MMEGKSFTEFHREQGGCPSGVIDVDVDGVCGKLGPRVNKTPPS